MSQRKVIYVVSHPIQYFSPQYREMIEAGINLEVWYCSDDGVKPYYDPDFDQQVKWDIPLLEGYPHRFFKNSGKGLRNKNSFWSLINFGVIRAISQLPKDSMVVIHGWAYFTHWLAMIYLKMRAIPIYLKGDSNILSERFLSTAKAGFKKCILGLLFKKLVNGALYIGEMNKRFYLKYGMKQGQLHFAPMAVDDARFHPSVESLRDHILIRSGWSEDSVFMLYVGKLVSGKNIDEVLRALALVNNSRLKFILVGDGPCKNELEKTAELLGLHAQVRIFGFVNQKKVPAYYKASDLVVLPSRKEAWGLSVNEAMMVGKPVLVSDRVGCGPDLVDPGQNGFIYPLGEVDQLAIYLEHFSGLSKLERQAMGARSSEIIKKYTYSQHVRAVQNLIGK